jgi:hypothetical protein
MVRGVRPSHYDGHRVAEYADTTVLQGATTDRNSGGLIEKRTETLSLFMTDDAQHSRRTHIDVWLENIFNERVLFHPETRLFADLTWTLYPRGELCKNDPIVGNYIIQLEGNEGWWRLPGLVNFTGSALRGDGPFLRGYEVTLVSLTLAFDDVNLDGEIFLSHLAVEMPAFLADEPCNVLCNVPWKVTGKEDDVVLRPGQYRYKRVNPLCMSQIWVRVTPTSIYGKGQEILQIGRTQLVVHVRRQEWAITK